jgi:two-component system, chemotaxis family, chemotaxis protein CheY
MKILLADDNDTIRQVLRQQLVGNGFDVCGEAVDGVQAVAKARELKPDLVLLDRSMPKLDGVGVVSVLKKEMPDVPIVLLTLYVEAADSFAMEELGVDMVLGKTDGIDNLVRHINELFESHSKRAKD